ncbi:MAG: hypothetical protein Q8M22_06630, partial [Actinomycetota bacterium]|nr:hypothetical protein [Actinomycetota bacterium]
NEPQRHQDHQPGRYALPATEILAVDRIDERIGPERRREAKWVPVLRRVGAQVLKKRLPPRFCVRRLRHTGSPRVDVLAATVAAKCRSQTHR